MADYLCRFYTTIIRHCRIKAAGNQWSEISTHAIKYIKKLIYIYSLKKKTNPYLFNIYIYIYIYILNRVSGLFSFPGRFFSFNRECW